MIIPIRGDSIDIIEIPLNQHIEWESLPNELNSEHIPGWYQDGKRMGLSVVEGKAHVFYLSDRKDSARAADFGNPQASRDCLTRACRQTEQTAGHAAFGR